jgi:hypothetical protein
MGNYTVQAGDTLSGIAAKTLGDSGKWRLLMELNRLANPDRLRVGQVLHTPEAAQDVPEPRAAASAGQQAGTAAVRIVEQGKVVFAIAENEQWVKIGTRYKAGLYRVGRYAPEAFIQQHGALLDNLALRPTEIRVMAATAKNEGNLDAINTWDSQFLSFGMFQWTAGSADRAGELAALLARIKGHYPDDYQHYFGRFGLDVVDTGSVTGWLSLKGETLRSKAQKQRLRDDIWAYRFAIAGADPQVQAAEVAHAVGRIRQFYPKPSRKLGGHALADLITSEYGVALLLDNHVNRPGYVHSCVAEAITRCGLTPQRLADGGSADEQAVIDAYLQVRETYGRYPMTDAAQRARVTLGYLTAGEISAQRGSFA